MATCIVYSSTDVDGCLYRLLQHRNYIFPTEWSMYLHLQFNVQLTRIFCKSLILMLLNLLRRIRCCFLVTSCPLVRFTKPALVISSSMHFVHPEAALGVRGAWGRPWPRGARVSVSRLVCYRKHWLCQLQYKRHPSTTLRNLTLKKDIKRSMYQHFQFTGEYSLTNS